MPASSRAGLRGRRRPRVRAATAATATALTTVLLVGCGVGSSGGGSGDSGGSGTPSPLAALTGALTRTSAASYRFSLDMSVHYAGRTMRSDLVSGAIDPGHDRGTERLTARSAQQPTETAQFRFIGQYLYTQVSPLSERGTFGRPWDKAPVPPLGTDALPPGSRYGFSTEQPVSPAELLTVLGSAATVRVTGLASGAGWSGTGYAFARQLGAGESLSGTVQVDQQGRVRRLVTITTDQPVPARPPVTMDRSLTFTDFGAPVPVTTPAAGQARDTASPYWGFFF